MKPLVAWFDRARRDLPWREEPRDPYRVWVSEIMLQQTRVETVLAYYAPFLRVFPDVASLARAPEERLMKAWEGLGYYRRARLLRAGAQHVVEHGMPRTRDEWLSVPGVGAYTAGAIASLTTGERVAAVDGNVLRVWARVTGNALDVTTPAARRQAEAWVLAHQPHERAGAFNEALMELGALVCTPRAPLCATCPIADSCAGRDRAHDLPHKRAKPPPSKRIVSLALVRRGSRLLLEKRDEGLLAGTWGLPWVEGGRAALAKHVTRLVGAPVEVSPRGVTRGSHTFTHRVWDMRVYEVTTRGRGGTWRAPGEVALGSAHRKILGGLVEP